MDNDERKPRFHINIGGLIILIIIIIVLFKVDIKSKIQSPQLKENITYIETSIKNLWQKYILTPVKSKTGEIFMDTTNKALEKIQSDFSKNVLKTDSSIDLKN